jgi:RNA polymerase sigma-70 factor (ECF subfamily)
LHNEKELFVRISEGDEAAFEVLFHFYVREIRPLILDIIKSEAYLKDVVQEIFLDIWLNREKLPSIEKPRNWIFKLTYNRCYGWLEKQLVREKAKTRLAVVAGNAAAYNVVEDDLAFRETASLLQAAIHALPSQGRHIYQMSRTDGLTIAAIAEKLNIAPQSVKNSLHRSGVSVKQFLAEKGIVIPLALLISLFF